MMKLLFVVFICIIYLTKNLSAASCDFRGEKGIKQCYSKYLAETNVTKPSNSLHVGYYTNFEKEQKICKAFEEKSSCLGDYENSCVNEETFTKVFNSTKLDNLMFQFLEKANKYLCNVNKNEFEVNQKLNLEIRTTNKNETWIMAQQTKIANQFGVDGVDVIPILKKDSKKYIILIKQFRDPIRKWIIEFPSGYIDETDKSIEEAGIRELKEETGYTVTKVIRSTKKGQFLNPSVTSDLDAIMVVEIDGNDPINKNPKQNLDESENVSEVIQIEYQKLLEFCDKIIEKGDVEISTQVYTFALSSLF